MIHSCRPALVRSLLVSSLLAAATAAPCSADAGHGRGENPTTTTTTSTSTTTTSTTSTTTTTAPEFAPMRPCGDCIGDGTLKASDALFLLGAAVDSNRPCPTQVCDVTGGLDGVKASDALVVLRVAVGASKHSALRCPSVARLWDERLLGAIRIDTPRPTVHARNLFHLSVAMWDAWVAYDHETSAKPYLFVEKPPLDGDAYTARSVAMSYAAYNILRHRFATSPGKVASLAAFDAQMDALGFPRDFDSTEGDSPAAVGNRIAAAVLAYGLADGSNEANGYADNTGYHSVNAPMYPKLKGTEMNDPNRWQPLSLDFFISQNGIPEPITVQSFVSPNWDGVKPFALVRQSEGEPYVDPGLPPQLGGDEDQEYKQAALQVIRFSNQLSPDDTQTIDISPGAHGNNDLGTNNGNGRSLNPITGEAYPSQLVKRGDWGRVLTEFWADGPKSETPPGHWNVVANYVADHLLFEKRIGGVGDVLDNLQWDVKVYLALNGAVHDAAVAAWGNKAIYDSVRPISMIRYMAGKGQSSDPDGPSYDPAGLPLEEGLVEVITAESSAPGQRHEALAANVGEIAIHAWLGNPADPKTQHSGTGWVLGENWLPYQLKTFVTPAFPGYVSGHSTFSRSGAEVLTAITGSPFFPGGLGEFHAAKDEFLRVELGPTDDVTLQWATYQDAADDAGISRLYGGIHVRYDDFKGRIMGNKIGQDAYALASKYWDGTVE